MTKQDIENTKKNYEEAMIRADSAAQRFEAQGAWALSEVMKNLSFQAHMELLKICEDQEKAFQ